MVGLSLGLSLPRLYEVLGRDAEFVYATSLWLPELVDVRAGGLIPIARQYPGARDFVESFKKEFPGASHFPAQAYGGCQILVEAVRRAGSLDGEKLRDTISKMDHNTVFGRFRVDRDGVQIGHKMLLFQWQDGKRVIVWPRSWRRTSHAFRRRRGASGEGDGINAMRRSAASSVDRDGVQIAHKFVIFQWQDGKRAIVWPEELAPGTPRFPTPPWSQRQ